MVMEIFGSIFLCFCVSLCVCVCLHVPAGICCVSSMRRVERPRCSRPIKVPVSAHMAERDMAIVAECSICPCCKLLLLFVHTLHFPFFSSQLPFCYRPLSLSLCFVPFVFMGKETVGGTNPLLDALLILEIKLHLTVDCAHNCRALPGGTWLQINLIKVPFVWVWIRLDRSRGSSSVARLSQSINQTNQ